MDLVKPEIDKAVSDLSKALKTTPVADRFTTIKDGLTGAQTTLVGSSSAKLWDRTGYDQYTASIEKSLDFVTKIETSDTNFQQQFAEIAVQNPSYVSALLENPDSKIAELDRILTDYKAGNANALQDLANATGTTLTVTPATATATATAATTTATTATTGADDLNKLAEAVQMDTELEQAFKHAQTNPQFGIYLKDKIDQAAASGGTSLVSSITKSLVKTDTNGNQFLDPNVTGPLKGVLNTIGNDPSYDMTLLNRLGDTIQVYNDAKDEHATRKNTYDNDSTPGITQAQAEDLRTLKVAETEALHEMVKAIRDAGGVTNAFATVDQKMKMQFLKDLLSPKPVGGADFAITQLVENSGMSEGQAQALRDMITPYMGLIEHMIGPYAQYFQKYGPELMGYVEGMGINIGRLAGSDQEISNNDPAYPPVKDGVVALGKNDHATSAFRKVNNVMEKELVEQMESFGLDAAEQASLEEALKDVAKNSASAFSTEYGRAIKGTTVEEQKVDTDEQLQASTTLLGKAFDGINDLPLTDEQKQSLRDTVREVDSGTQYNLGMDS